ncbi:MAG: hypothetical protein ACK58T_45905, partial [Phycisphaerae bacterium]
MAIHFPLWVLIKVYPETGLFDQKKHRFQSFSAGGKRTHACLDSIFYKPHYQQITSFAGHFYPLPSG